MTSGQLEFWTYLFDNYHLDVQFEMKITGACRGFNQY